MRNTQITSKGLTSIANADFGGFKLTVDKFAVTGKIYGDSEVLSDALKGTTILHRGTISAIEVLNDASVQYECVLPRAFPTSGNILVGEIGLYLDNGELFAVGKILPTVVKDFDTAISLTIVVAASKLGGVINVTVSDKTSLSRTTANRLIDPSGAVSNTVIVADAGNDLESNTATPTLAIKLGGTENEWSFLGFKKVIRSLVQPISPHSFTLEPNSNGFWLNDGEWVIGQIVSGTGAGQIRKFQYHKSLVGVEHLFECDSKFALQAFGPTSVLTIWRSADNELPDRRGVPNTQVLFAGENTHSASWDTSIPVPGSLSLKAAHFTAQNNQYQFPIPDSIPRAYGVKVNTLLFINGELKAFNDYDFYDNTLITSPRAGNDLVSLYVFHREDSDGGNVRLYEELIELAKVEDYQGKASFNMPVVIEDPNKVIGFSFKQRTIGHEAKQDWFFNGARLVFNTAPQNDTLVVALGVEEVLNGYSQPKQYEWVYSANNNAASTNQHVFKISYTPTENFVLFVRGLIVPKRLYTVANNTIRINKRDLAITNGDNVRFLIIANMDAVNGRIADISTTKVEPNRVFCDVVTMVTPFNKIDLRYAPINDNYVLLFAHGMKQDKSINWKMQGTKSVVLLETLPAGYPVDVVYFYEETTTKGYAMDNKAHAFKTKANQSYYTIPFRCNPNETIAFADTLYLHKNAYSLQNVTENETVILLADNPVQEGISIEIINFGNKEEDNSRTELVVRNPDAHIGLRTFNVESAGTLQRNSLLFIGPTYIHQDSYRVRGAEVVLDRSVPYAILDPQHYEHLGIEMLTFASGRDLINLDLELAALAQVQKPARNTGPFWADPAGTNRNPNKMKVSVKTYISSPATKYLFTPPSTSGSIMVFVHGTYQNPDHFAYLSLGEIAFKSKIPDGFPVDIVTFQATDDEIGYKLDTKVFEVVSNMGNDYTVGFPLEDEQNVFVFVEGVYFHKTWYKLVSQGKNFKLQFNSALIEDLRVEIVIWSQTESKGSYTECVVQIPNATVGAKNIVLKEEVERKNTFIFAGPVYQGKSTYKVNQLTLQLDTPIDYQYVDPINFKDMPTVIFGFRTGVSKSRLVTRDELRDGYMTKFGGDLLGPLYTNAEPESDSEVANKKYVDRLETQIAELKRAVELMQGVGSSPTYAPILSAAPNLLTVGSTTTIKITNASPGKSVELEVRGSSGVFNARSIKGNVKLDGTFTIGPVGVDNGYSDFLTITAWVDGFKVANSVDIKVTDGTVISGPAMISVDKDIYVPYDYITFSIADGTPGGRVTWSTNGAAASAVPSGQPQFIANDGTWSMQIPAGGVPTSYGVELFVDNVSVGSVNIIVSPSSAESLPKLTYSAAELYRDEVLDVQVINGKPYAPVAVSARAIGLSNAGPLDTVGLIDSNGKLNFGLRFVSPGDYVIYVNIDRKLFTHSLKVKKVSPTDPLITEQPDGYRAYIKQY